jgi:hypothetical protein
MKSETKTATVSEYQGKPVSSYGLKDENGNPITSLDYSWDETTYESPAELRESGKWPNDAES